MNKNIKIILLKRFNLEPAPIGCVTGDHSVQDGREGSVVLNVLRLQRPNVTYQVRYTHAVSVA